MKKLLNLSAAAVTVVLVMLAGCAKNDSSAPTLTTTGVTNIQNTTATGGGIISSDGGQNVVARGICWATTHNPTTTNSNAPATSIGSGSFTVYMTGLTMGTTYYVRAWATNTVGTSYGNEVTFTTNNGTPVVTTAAVSTVQSTYAIGGGTVTNEGLSAVTNRGICWDTTHNPTINGPMSQAYQGGIGSFQAGASPLLPNTTYYLRAWATNSAGTSYGAEVSFTTPSDLLMGRPWYYTSYKILNYNGTSNTIDVLAANPCQSDNSYLFQAGGTYAYSEGSNVCSPSQAKVGTWQYAGGTAQLVFDGNTTFDIDSLTTDKLKMTMSTGISGTYEIVLHH